MAKLAQFKYPATLEYLGEHDGHTCTVRRHSASRVDFHCDDCDEVILQTKLVAADALTTRSMCARCHTNEPVVNSTLCIDCVQ